MLVASLLQHFIWLTASQNSGILNNHPNIFEKYSKWIFPTSQWTPALLFSDLKLLLAFTVIEFYFWVHEIPQAGLKYVIQPMQYFLLVLYKWSIGSLILSLIHDAGLAELLGWANEERHCYFCNQLKWTI